MSDCPHCGHARTGAEGPCPHCGAFSAGGKTVTPNADLYATVRTLERLHNQGALSAQLYGQLMKLLRDELAQLAGSTKPTPTSKLQTDEVITAEVVTPKSAQPPEQKAPSHAPSEEEGIQYLPAPAQPSGQDRHRAQEPAPVPRYESPRQTPRVPQPAETPISPRAPAAEPSTPRRTIADLLQAFMEESNIRWGELICGLLIIGCSIALVVSLRNELNAIPYFPALLFMLSAGAINGAGLYTLRRWNLPSTSRTMLIIGVLMVPLSFVAGIVLAGQGEQQREVTDPIYLIAVGVGLLSFGAMTYFTSRALMKRGWWRMAAGVLIPSAAQLVINRLAYSGMSTLHTTALAALPLAGFLVASLAQIQRAAVWARLSPRRVGEMYLLLGVAAFSLLAPLGLLVWKADAAAIGETLRQLSPTLSLAAAAVLATGLMIQQLSIARQMAGARTTGTAIAVLGGMLMAILVALAWPEPEMLIAVGLLNGGVLVALAVLGRLPVLHTAAVVCFALAFLVGFHRVIGTFDAPPDGLSRRLVEAALMGRSAAAMTLFALLAGALAVGWLRMNRRDDAVWTSLGAAGIAALGMLVALYVGFAAKLGLDEIGLLRPVDPDVAAPLFLFYAIAALAAGMYVRRPYVTAAGGALLWLALAQALAANETIIGWLGSFAPERGVLTATLAHAAICAALAVASDQWLQREQTEGRRRAPLFRGVVAPLTSWALVSSFGAGVFVLYVSGQHYTTHAVYAGVIAAVWLALAINFRWQPMFWAFQAGATVSLWYTLSAIGLSTGAWNGATIDIGFLPVQTTVLAGWCIACMMLRRMGERWTPVRELMSPPAPWPAVDHLLLGGLVFVPLLAAMYGCLPGVAVELDLVESAAQVVESDPYTATFGPAAWLAITAVLAATAVALWERFTLVRLIGAVCASAALPLMAAGQFDDAHAVASAVRWGFALWGGVLVALVCLRVSLLQLVQAAPWLRLSDTFAGSAPLFRALVLSVSGAPLFGLTLLAAAQVFDGAHPEAGSVFAAMGDTWSYPLPLLAYVAMLVALALRERTPAYMLAGSAVLHLVVNLLYTLAAKLAGNVAAAQFAVELLQWNAVAAPAYALVWLGLRRWLEPMRTTEQSRERPPLLEIQLVASLALAAALCAWTALLLVFRPSVIEMPLAWLGRWLSYTAWTLTLAASIWALKNALRRWGVHLVGGFTCGLAALVAATVVSYTRDGWLGLHVLTAGWLLAAATLAALARFDRTPSATIWSTAIAGVLVTISIGSAPFDVWDWWPGSVVAVTAVIAGVLAWHPPRESYKYVSTALASLAAVIWYGRLTRQNNFPFDMFEWPTIAALGCALFWLVLELRRQRAQPAEAAPRGWRLQHVVALTATVVLASTLLPGSAACSLIPRASATIDASSPLGGVALLLLGGLLVGMLWDRTATSITPLALVWGIVAFTLLLDQHQDAPFAPVLRSDPALLARFTWMAWGLSLAAYAALVARLWHRRHRLAWLGGKLGIPNAAARMEHVSLWLPAVISVMALLATLLGLVDVLTYPHEERWLRVSAAFAPALAALACAWLTERGRESAMHELALVAATFSALLLSWADMRPILSSEIEVLHWTVRMLVVLAGLTLVYGLAARWLLRRGSDDSHGGDWYGAVRRTALGCGVASLFVLAVVLALELAHFQASPHVLATSEVAMVALVLVALIAALLMLALLPGADPLALSEELRQTYVYAAQIVAALIFSHLYLSRPEWFAGLFARYWPYIVMAIAFGGVGLGEFFQRLRVRVLAEPLTRTGAFLPLLPAIGIWQFAGETSRPLLLMAVGLLYAIVAMMRRSVVSGLAAAIAGNAALLALMYEQGVEFKDNPQFWLIPPAISTLVAAQVNRKRLDEQSLTAIRYCAMLVIYVSSTYEVFERGFTNDVWASLWPPMVLILLSIAGVLAGMLLRIRAFLYLGTTFVLVAITSMVHHSAQSIHQTWPWWVFGLGLGLTGLSLLGLLELKRPEILQYVERMRKWDH